MNRWTLGGMVAACLGVVSAPPARAAEPASFEWSAPLSCPGLDAMQERLRQAGGPPGLHGTTALDARVTVEQAAEDRYRARVELVADHHWSERSLEASSCEAIAEAVVVILRVAAAAAAPASPSPVSPPVPSSPAASLPGAPAAEVPAPVAASQAPSVPPVQVPPPPPVPLTSAPPVDDDTGRGFSARAAFALDAGTRSDATPGFGIGAAWRGAHVRFAFDLGAFAPPPMEPTLGPGLVPAGLPPLIPQVPAGYPGAGVAVFSWPDAHAWLLMASLEGCASEPLRRGKVLVDACLGVALEHPRFGSAAFGVVPMGELAAEWWPTRAFAVRASSRWLLDVPRRSQATALVAFEPSLGLVVHLGK